MKHLKRHLITGLLVIAPIFLTAYVIIVIFKFADGILGDHINAYVKSVLGFYIPGLGVILSLAIILTVGFFTELFIGKKILPYFEKIFCAFPLVKNIYPAFKQLVSFLLAQKKFNFKKVVLVEYPSRGIWSIGFLTNEKNEVISNALGREMLPVFIGTTPGPFSGFVVFIPKEEVKFIDIPITEALKILISGGVYKPEKLKQN